MSYLYWLLGLEEEEPEIQDELKDRQKHLKYLCCKSIETSLPRLKKVVKEIPMKRRKKISHIL